jgi:hypothetical protein
VQLYGSTALDSTGFEAVSSGTVSTVLKLANINIDCEYTLMSAVLRWCNAEYQRRSSEIPVPTRWQIFAPFKTHIRFLNMTPQQFATSVIDTGIICELEAYYLLLKLTLPDRNIKLPQFLNKTEIPRTVNISYIQHFYTFGIEKKALNECGRLNDDTTRLNDLYDLISTMYVAIDNLQDILYGVKIPSKEKYGRMVSQVKHDEKVSIYVIDVTTEVCVYNKTIKISEACNIEGNINIMFDAGIKFSDNPLFNQRKTILSEIKIRVVIHESGVYPITLTKSKGYESKQYPEMPNFVLQRPFQHNLIIAAFFNK